MVEKSQFRPVMRLVGNPIVKIGALSILELLDMQLVGLWQCLDRLYIHCLLGNVPTNIWGWIG